MEFNIGNRKIGIDHPTYFIAELSCNHHGSLDKALELVRLAKEAGADAVKTQTYTGDTITLKCNKDCFKLKNTNGMIEKHYGIYLMKLILLGNGIEKLNS